MVFRLREIQRRFSSLPVLKAHYSPFAHGRINYENDSKKESRNRQDDQFKHEVIFG
jgi:hypothetical protein